MKGITCNSNVLGVMDLRRLVRILLVVVLTCLMAAPAFGRDETLISGPVDHGGFGGPSIKVADINGKTAFLMGGYGGWFINHAFMIGGGGYGMVNDLKAPFEVDGKTLYYELGYGGLMFEYVDNSHRLFHFTVNTLVGAGELSYRSKNDAIFEKYADDTFFVLEPSFNVELNVTTHFRVGLGVSYRYIDGLDIAGTTEEELSGVSANLNFKFGAF